MGSAQSGAVLSVRVFGATPSGVPQAEARAYRTALARLLGRDLGGDVRAWRRWWRKEGRLQKEPAPPSDAEHPRATEETTRGERIPR